MAETRLVRLELAGLPGVGKTTVTRALATRASNRASFFGLQHYWLRKLRLIWLFAPYVRIRFRRVFERLKNADPQVRRSILYLLSAFSAERTLASIEARITGRLLVLDEGFVQRGLGLWMRAPKAVRDDVWGDFLDCLPSPLTCVVLTLDSEEAQRRAHQRSQGLSPALVNAEPGMESDETLTQRYRGLEQLLHGEALRRRVECLFVPADTDPEALADRILSAIAEAFPDPGLGASLVFVRTPHPDD